MTLTDIEDDTFQTIDSSRIVRMMRRAVLDEDDDIAVDDVDYVDGEEEDNEADDVDIDGVDEENHDDADDNDQEDAGRVQQQAVDTLWPSL